MSETAPSLDVQVRRRIHAGLCLDVELRIGPTCAVVFGPSGAGKTSLLRLIAGLDRPDAGHIRLETLSLTDTGRRQHLPLRDRRTSMIFQHDLLFPHLDVRRNIAFGLAGWRPSEARDRVEEVSALCGTQSLLDRRVGTLSGGERQRVGLARALAPKPRLLLCDEPVSALDLDARFELLDHLDAAQRAEGIPVLYVTHSLAEAVRLGRVLLLLRDGRIAEEGPPLEVLAGQLGGNGHWEGLRNRFRAVVADHAADGTSTALALEGGPHLIVPAQACRVGVPLGVSVAADDILLSRGPLPALSARNVLHGQVTAIYRHGHEAEVVVRTERLDWIVSVVEPALAALDLAPGAPIVMLIKARSCRVSP